MSHLEENNSYILVEGRNDKFFIEAVVNHLNLKNIEVKDFGGIEDFEKPQKLINMIKTRFNQIERSFNITTLKLGIILDQDEPENNRYHSFNHAIFSSFGYNSGLSANNQTENFKYKEIQISISVYIMNVNGQGELSTMLKAIKNKPSKFADCLDVWRKCADSEANIISDIEHDKNWYHYYIKYDNSTHKERQLASKYCTFENSLINKTEIWDFENKHLEELKKFLIKITQ